MKTILFIVMVLCLIAGTTSYAAMNIYDVKVKTIEGKDQSLAHYKGKVLLIVNTASKCGYTSQYNGLEALYNEHKKQGFEVLAFPANNFKGQEPGTNEDIKSFCQLNYKTTFPLFAKISVKGEDMVPLYQYLTAQSGFDGDISWNFNKFLVDRNGKVVARFESAIEPQDAKIEDEIKRLLALKTKGGNGAQQ